MTRIRILLDIVNTEKFCPNSESCGMVVYILVKNGKKYLIIKLNFICMLRRGNILHMRDNVNAHILRKVDRYMFSTIVGLSKFRPDF